MSAVASAAKYLRQFVSMTMKLAISIPNERRMRPELK